MDGSRPPFKKTSARPVGDLVSRLLDPVIERRAGMTMDLISSWTEIVGVHHGSKSAPRKLDWPRQASDEEPFEPATLIVSCDAGHVLFMQHDTSTIVSRVNAWFGFAAVARVKFTQRDAKAEQASSNLAPPDPQKTAKLACALAEIDDPNLRSALQKMGVGVFSRGS